MADGLEQVAVLSDQLQARGEPRGELLALELAAARAIDVGESQRLNREAQQLRSRMPTLAWPPALHGWRGLIRAGLLVDGGWAVHEQPELPAAIGPHCRSLVVPLGRDGLGLAALSEARARAGVRLDGLWEERDAASDAVMEARHSITHRLELAAVGLERRLSDAASLGQLDGLRTLELGPLGVPDDLLEGLRTLALRGLGVRLDDCDQLRAVLDACPELEQLTLHELEPALPGVPALQRLRRLALLDIRTDPPMQPRLADHHSLTGLDSLLISKPCLEDLERLADLQLRSLIILNPHGDPSEVANKLAKLRSLERLTLLGYHERSWRDGAADVSALGQLPLLRALTLNGRLQAELEAGVELTEYGAPFGLRLRGPIAELYTTMHEVPLQFDPSQLQTGVSASVDVGEQLAAIETLVLDGPPDHDTLAWAGGLPRLRTVITRWLPLGEQQALAEQLPHVQILGEDAPRLRNEWFDLPPFDPLAVASWPKLA